ncbi:MFS polyamine transporter [Laccaria bicolor S238N-H82]|uniref:MFS polyamine transporter n=1 Tax=Laccaria bicolor (strain S238N-H82 / ATCC MYA-4686) TaxID=486041 RepID=B0DPR5_LACBS|nr:MFS polyamine transporter [Laccaria bicolor S238N-H82]EDR03497.1 MFS polyamine transporter [Laccaria bicolor S238N-H82]|eukprot:XP_001885953.1 MFS polyamine transporter [Laccaria bicolor S238N-H82]
MRRSNDEARCRFITIAASFLCLAVAIGSSIVTGDIEGPTRELRIRQVITNLTVTCFVMGFGIGPLFLAPLSEIFGRKPIYCISMFFYFIFTLPSALAHVAGTLIVPRMIAGLAASAPMCNVGGTIADVWETENRGAPMGIFSGTIFLGPCVGPIIGGWIGQRAGWRWIYWVLFIFVGATFLFTLVMPETLAPVLLKKKAARLRKETGDPMYRTLEELEKKPFKEVVVIALLRPFIMLFTEPIIICMTVYLSFVYALLYLLFFAFPIAFAEIRHFSLGITGTTFVSIMIGIIGALCLIPVQEMVYKRATTQGDYPEARLFPMMFGAPILPIALFIFAWTGAYAHVHWIAPLIAGVLFGFAMLALYVSANSYIIDSYSAYAASAIAAKTFLRSEVGAVVPVFVTPMFHNMKFQWAGFLLAMISVLIAPIPYIFFMYGERVRRRSKKATKAVKGGGEGREKKGEV